MNPTKTRREILRECDRALTSLTFAAETLLQASETDGNRAHASRLITPYPL